MSNSKLHQVNESFATKGSFEVFKQAQEAFSKPQTVETESRFKSIAGSLGAPQTARAIDTITAVGAGSAVVGAGCVALGAFTAWTGPLALVAYGTCAALAGPAISIAAGWLLHSTGADEKALRIIFNAFIPIIFTFLTAISMLTAAVILYLRLIAMVLLGVSAPIAFLGIAFPKYGQQFWSKWISHLFRWAATAPIFYFLLYLALLMLQTNKVNINSTGSGQMPIIGNLYMILNLVLFLIFLWTAVYATKKTAGHFAEVALSLGRKGLGFAAGAATGFMVRRALPYYGQAAEAGGRAIGEIKSPLLRGILRTPAKILRRTATASRKQILEAQGRIGAETSADIQRAIGAGEYGEADLAGAMSVLQSRGQITALPNIKNYGEAQQLAGKNTLRRLGLDFNGFLRANPKLARPEDFSPGEIEKEISDMLASGRTINNIEAAQRLTWSKKVRPEHMRTMDLDIIDPANPLMIEQLLELGSGEHLRELMRFNPTVAKKVQKHLDDKTTSDPTFYANRTNESIKRYFENNIAQSFGWHAPPGVVPRTPGTPPVIRSTSIPAWPAGSTHSFTPIITGGTGTMTWRFAGGFTRPMWLTINPDTGEITANATAPASTLSVPIIVEDSTGAISTPQTFLIRIT